MKRRVIYNLLAFAALLSAMGSDCLSTAAMAVRTEAVVNVAERMAEEFTKVFPRRQSQRAFPLEQSPQFVVAAPQRVIAKNVFPHQVRHCSPHVLYLPPPLA